MAPIVSATTRFTRTGRGTRRADFLSKASALLSQSVAYREEGNWEQALESAYQAALRTAGAWISESSVAGRRRRPTSAWDQLRLVGGGGEEWADTFSQYSRLRSRVVSGLERDLDHDTVDHIIALASEFLAMVEGDASGFPAAA
ncbi:hypothetical protein CATRI_08750 [Corynebacterium atrinae]|uniref:SAV_6107 family HEPN domain-containing protein n=1 Tax=Corynebacterium atrinae TaxID=1336740 RepID=UPI0025B3FA95|nr:SAV_6107 family HEPN domain-containing protein [Corynebacterium atrinae]WJY63822.1 hypothetical protein CATRI_08750 [Corynebacterium atrinae]